MDDIPSIKLKVIKLKMGNIGYTGMRVATYVRIILYYMASGWSINLVLPRLFTYCPSSRAQKDITT